MEIPQEFKKIIAVINFQTKAMHVIKAIVLLTNPKFYSLYLEDSCMGR